MTDAKFITDEEYLKREKVKLAKRGLQILNKNIVLRKRYNDEVFEKLILMCISFSLGIIFGILISSGV